MKCTVDVCSGVDVVLSSSEKSSSSASESSTSKQVSPML